MEKHRPRWVMVAVRVGLVGAVIVFLATLLLVYQQGLSTAANITGVLSFLLALFLGAKDLRRWSQRRSVPKDAHGLREKNPLEALARWTALQWDEEIRSHRLNDLQPAAVPCHTTTAPVTDHPDHVFPEGHPARPEEQGEARLFGTTDDAVGMARAFGMLERRRMVLLGPAGAGKTTTATLLMRALLEQREPGDPVPVLVPALEHLSREGGFQERLASWLRETFPALNSEVYGPDSARSLIERGSVIPVVDGLDELPEGLCAEFLRELNTSLSSWEPLVLTCRTEVFYQAVSGPREIVAGAAVIEAGELDGMTAAQYLRAALRDERYVDGPWSRLLDTLTTSPDHPVTDAFCTPLQLGLARLIYVDAERDVDELLDPALMPTAYAVTRHLLEHAIPEAVETRRGRSVMDRPWNAREARNTLTVLAKHMNRERTTDLVWWRLPQLIPFPVYNRMIRVRLLGFNALVVAPLFGLLGGILAGLLFGPNAGVGAGVGLGALVALLFLVYSRSGRVPAPLSPQRTNLRLRGRKRLLLRAIIQRTVSSLAAPSCTSNVSVCVVLGGVVGSGAMIWVWFSGSAGNPWATGLTAAALTLGAYLLLIPVSGVLVGFSNWAGSVDPESTVVTPESEWVGDLHGRLVRSVAVGLLQGLLATVAFVLLLGPFPGLTLGALFFAVTVLLTLVCGITPSALYRFVALALHRRSGTPLRLLTFLSDMHRIGLLRRIGSVYQFRHTLLQQHLAGGWEDRPAPEEAPSPVQASRPVALVPETVPYAFRLNGPEDAAVDNDAVEIPKELLRLTKPNPLVPSPSTVVISGDSACRTTRLSATLARELLHRRSFDHVLAVDAQCPDGTAVHGRQLLRSVLRAFGLSAASIPETPDSHTRMYHALRDYLDHQGASCLLIVDHVTSADQVKPLIPGSDRQRLVVTTQAALDIPDSALCEVRRLSAPDRVRMLSPGHPPGEPVGQYHDVALSLIASECGGRPMILRMARAVLENKDGPTADELLEQVRRQTQKGSSAAPIVAEHYYRLLPADMRKALRLLPLLPTTHPSVNSLDALFGVERIGPLFRELQRVGVLSASYAQGYLRVSPAGLADIPERAAPEDAEASAAVRRLLAHFARGASDAAEWLETFTAVRTDNDAFASMEEARRWVSLNGPELVWAVKRTAVVTDTVAHLTPATARCLDLVDDHGARWSAERALSGARRHGGPHELAQARLLYARTLITAEEEDLAEAELRYILYEDSNTDTKDLHARVISELGGILIGKQNFEGAVRILDRSREQARDGGDVLAELEAQNLIAAALSYGFSRQKGIDLLERVMEKAQRYGENTGDSRATTHLLCTLGDLHVHADRFSEAEEYFRAAAEQVRDMPGLRARITFLLAEAIRLGGGARRCLPVYRESASLFRRSGRLDGEIDVEIAIANVEWSNFGKEKNGLPTFRKAADFFALIGSDFRESLARIQLASALMDKRRAEEAVVELRRAQQLDTGKNQKSINELLRVARWSVGE